MSRLKTTSVICLSIVSLLGSAARAITIETVRVGDPGNAADTRYNGIAVGSVAYSYQMGKYEVTAGQYCEFLNAVAATDTYGLYNATNMPYPAAVSPNLGCNIQRNGSPGSYTYSVASEWANRPVNWVSWSDAARFANWLTNGQPSGGQNAATTEDGSYLLNGGTTAARKANARYVIPTEDEWYKAAYYDPQKSGGPGYWDYPTRSNAVPSNVLDPGGTNNANFTTGSTSPYNYTIGGPYWRTEVGTFAGSSSAYGTFDQAGNVHEWNEMKTVTGRRGLRGGSFNNNDPNVMHASTRPNNSATYEYCNLGFRVALIPEPATLAMLALLSGLAVIRRTA